MKKTKLILALLALLPFSGAFAQTGEIIYRDFEPDSILIYWVKLGPVWIDLDVDGEPDDLAMQMLTFDPGFGAGGSICAPELFTSGSNMRICAIEPDSTNIILSEVAEEDWVTYVGWSGPNGCDAVRYTHYGFRIRRDDRYYYGWFETYDRVISVKNGKRIVHHGFDRTAYCIVPDYPLRWGQTDILGVEENSETDNAFAIIHPNPTSGMVTVTGENLQQAEVLNMLGQRILGVHGKGNELHIDMAPLPAGVYFVSITDEEGHKCVRKVVKE
jgi:hypothetical protein